MVFTYNAGESSHGAEVVRIPIRPDKSTFRRVELLPRPDPAHEAHIVRRPPRLEAVAQFQQETVFVIPYRINSTET